MNKLCKICKQPVKKISNIFCSKKCFGISRRKRIKINCKICKKEFEIVPSNKDAKCCSRKCDAKYRKELYKGENNPSWKKPITKKCKWCKKEFKIHRYEQKRKFCSHKCYAKWHGVWQRGKNNPFWANGKSFEPYGLEFNNKLKEQIRQRDNYICQECKYPQEKLGYKLHIHHIDYNKQNNNPYNLISLCRNCHSQTHFNRNDWILYFQNKIKNS